MISSQAMIPAQTVIPSGLMNPPVWTLRSVLYRPHSDLPCLTEQEKIVAEIEAEQRVVEGNRQFIERIETKIAATLARIWGRSHVNHRANQGESEMPEK